MLSTLSLSIVVLAAQAADNPHLRIVGEDILETSAGAYEAELGQFSVLENRLSDKSGRITLTFARLKSSSPQPGPALFILPGGPGADTISMARSPVWKPYLELGDIVLMDPRGCGKSEPSMLFEPEGYRPDLIFGSEETAIATLVAACELASRHYRQQGNDLAGYTTTQMAADIDELRAALGYDRINILAHSFGTHLGQEILRRYPDSVARYVSAGTAGTNDMMKLPNELNQSLQQLSDLIADDPTVGKGMPEFYGAFEELVQSLDEDPLPVDVINPLTGGPQTVLLGAHGVRLIFVADLQDTNDLPVFPRLLRSLQDRDPSIVRWFLQKRLDQFSKLPVMMLCVRAASGATAERWEVLREQAKGSPFASVRCFFSPDIDRVLGVGDVGDAFREPIQASVPTLFISGSLDSATPVHQAERVREGFSDSRHVIVQYAGHDDLLPNPQVQDRILAFLAGEEVKDETLPGDVLRFAALTGPLTNVSHPSLRR